MGRKKFFVPFPLAFSFSNFSHIKYLNVYIWSNLKCEPEERDPLLLSSIKATSLPRLFVAVHWIRNYNTFQIRIDRWWFYGFWFRLYQQDADFQAKKVQHSLISLYALWVLWLLWIAMALMVWWQSECFLSALWARKMKIECFWQLCVKDRQTNPQTGGHYCDTCLSSCRRKKTTQLRKPSKKHLRI